MKALRLFTLTALLSAVTTLAFAQTKTESFQVSGNCGMCKTRIEKAAKTAGATEAKWDEDSKQLTVTYNSNTSNTAKIQQQVAAAGHDNAGFKATMDVYNKLPGCCKYDKKADDKSMDCCKDGKCKNEGHCDKPCCKKEGMTAGCKMEGHDGKDCCSKEEAKMDCCKDGKCKNEGHCDKPCCKKAEDKAMDCCKDGKCKNEGHCDKPCCKKDAAKMDCCKDGKCSKEGHDGKDCCKKS